MIRIAIAGNPNAGKTSLFNALTGAVQQVSNYPGVTVERKEGTARRQGQVFSVLDLPGTYSLTAYSQEESVARRALVEEPPDVIVNVVDASNLERNLYLTVQLMETGLPMVLALNMADVAERRGITVDTALLSQLLGIPVVPTAGHRGRGVDALLDACALVAGAQPPAVPRPVTYGHEVNREVDALAKQAETELGTVPGRPARWLAVKLIEGDPDLPRLLAEAGVEPAQTRRLQDSADRAREAIRLHFNEPAETILAERRHGFAAGALQPCITRRGEARQQHTDRIDAIVCNRYAGPLVLVGVVAALFFCVFKLSDEWTWIPWFGGWKSPTGCVEWVFEQTSQGPGGLRDRLPMLHSLLDDGVVTGVGGVVGFVPLIFCLFFFISLLEDTGYVARVAFILDRLLRAFGLQGKSILALLVSGGLGAGGCAVPGVMATRTLREEKDRLVTMLVVPFMNCGAKMPVHAMLIAAFFPSYRTALMLLLWAISWLVALCAAWFLRRFVIRGARTPFVMELPPYHVPTLRGALIHTWERTWMYVKKAGTIILAINILLWACMYFPRLPAGAADPAAAPGETAAQQLAHSSAGRLGRLLEPVSRWAGFDWRVNIALIGGFAAKEIVLGTLGTVYALGEGPGDDRDMPEGEGTLAARLARDPDWGPLRAFALMLFVMFYAPCLVTVSVIRRESGSWKWAAFSIVYSTAIAFALAAATFQLGRLAGLE